MKYLLSISRIVYVYIYIMIYTYNINILKAFKSSQWVQRRLVLPTFHYQVIIRRHMNQNPSAWPWTGLFWNLDKYNMKKKNWIMNHLAIISHLPKIDLKVHVGRISLLFTAIYGGGGVPGWSCLKAPKIFAEENSKKPNRTLVKKRQWKQ